MTITSYDTLNTLPEISFIAGSDKVFTFTCYDSDGVITLNIAGGPAYWKLCPYGSPTIETLSKSGNIISASKFTITLTAADTLALSGKYIQQVIITDYLSNTYRPAQGTIVVIPAVA